MNSFLKVSTSIVSIFLIVASLSACKNSNIEKEKEAVSVAKSAPLAFEVDDDIEESKASFLPQLNTSPQQLSAVCENWWVGTDVDDENRPMHCVQMQEELGEFGLLGFGPAENAVYLSFDFGYETGYSQQILDTFAEKNAKGNFFLVTGYIENQPETIARMVGEGHSIGSHSTTHPGAPNGVAGLSGQQQIDEITQAGNLMLENYDYNCRLFRFPEGIFSPNSVLLAAKNLHYSVFWSYAYNDWDANNQPNEQESLQKALAAAHPGAIYLLHPQKTNANILPKLIDELRILGYEPTAL